MNIATSIALLDAYPFVSLAVVSETLPETALDVTGPKGSLEGTLFIPNSKPTAVVLIVPGSGPTDRGGNNPLDVNTSSRRLLAEGLAVKGFMTFRIDRREVFASVTAVDDANTVMIVDYVDDIRSWVDMLRRHIYIPCVWVLEHSERGLVAFALTQGENMCGVVLIATPGRPMGEVLRGRFSTNPENKILLKQALPIIDALEYRRRVDITSIHPTLQSISNSVVQGSLINAFLYNPGHLISSISKPVPVLWGQRDP